MSHRTTRPPAAVVHPARFPALPGALLPADALADGLSRELAERALCGFDPELHTGPDAFTDEPDDERAAREQVAREVCAECPARVACLRRALRLAPNAGVWAGFTPDELAELPHPAAVPVLPELLVSVGTAAGVA
ncbi:WhiB family transcriptional regulator [Sphaerisporangium sp. NPDC051017]|uniref:WhiB family transcriptional regulator n=1 Tax=Sphaerisporangium sp. NPDC051017 TaxID=3154636 RepID=UPI00342B3A17